MLIKQGLVALLVAGSFVGLGRVAVAQQMTPIQDTSTSQNQSGSSTLSSSTKQFLNQTAQDSLYELASAELAMQRAQSPTTAQVALHVFNDHAEFQRALLQLGRQYGLSLPVDLSAKNRSKLESLSDKQGTAFDQQYLQELYKSNASSVSDFQREGSMVKEPDVQAFIKNFLPTQQEHLKLANAAMNGSSGMTGSSSGSSSQ
ncbi:MAG: DUF4142 domain-containing protein [Chroococcidiopsidaceae cyanobacterium CP_BM_ER_R8_30]|nr:DUF4142 domain-containing protein [Chroococcidiopsidaceae cyanobacterium CP_BM_ER_R8_30]